MNKSRKDFLDNRVQRQKFYILGVFPLVIADTVYAVNVYYSGKESSWFWFSSQFPWAGFRGRSRLLVCKTIPVIGKDYIPDIDCEKIGTFLVYLWIIAEFRVWIDVIFLSRSSAIQTRKVYW